MWFTTRQQKIRKAKLAVCAVGFTRRDDPNKITIIGSCFVISKNKNRVAGCYHIINPNPPTNFDRLDLPNLKSLIPIEKDQNNISTHYEWRPMKLIKEDRENDIAVYEVENLNDSIAQELKLGDSDKVKEGDDIYFVGYPYAAQIRNEGWGYTEILNRGIISTIKFGNPQTRVFILVDAISNPGNSGCPLLLERNNRVVGVMTNAFRKKSEVQKYNDIDIREPMHFGGARPINALRKILSQIDSRPPRLS